MHAGVAVRTGTPSRGFQQSLAFRPPLREISGLCWRLPVLYLLHVRFSPTLSVCFFAELFLSAVCLPCHTAVSVCHAMPGAPGKGSQSFFHNQRHAHACHASSCAGSGCWLRLLADDPAAAV
jgi:hypothetical protein